MSTTILKIIDNAVLKIVDNTKINDFINEIEEYLKRNITSILENYDSIESNSYT